ncbi:winged helix-turn-helix transcriptional regulator [Catenulispora pinisilvae]|uniref:winged helix-turn-helix transcriptional regulator n=1 Tax=Catenulispora pinisilvae TaxID=2705253 RepID=UPI0018917650|nr:helix-turn-helix domain-containing protein [Catenulispora pinisilvae]
MVTEAQREPQSGQEYPPLAPPPAPVFPGPPAACQEHGGKGRFVRTVLERIGDKWSLMIIGGLHEGPLRFTALQQSIGGISQRMLTLNLRHLERDGLISRTVYAEVPPRVEYELTELGHSLLVPVLGLVNWAADHAELIETQRDTYDAALEGSSKADVAAPL